MQRSQVVLECPGTGWRTIIDTAWQSQFGVGNPKNVGTCELYVLCIDEDGAPIPPPLSLLPGDSRYWFTAQPRTTKIVAACSTEYCHGQAVLEYDTPIA
jgi:hypothetical protein